MLTKKQRRSVVKQLGLVQGRKATTRVYIQNVMAESDDGRKSITIVNDPTSPRAKYQRAKRGTL